MRALLLVLVAAAVAAGRRRPTRTPARPLGDAAQCRADLNQVYAACGVNDATFPELSAPCCRAHAAFMADACPCRFLTRLVMGVTFTQPPRSRLDALVAAATNATCAGVYGVEVPVPPCLQ